MTEFDARHADLRVNLKQTVLRRQALELPRLDEALFDGGLAGVGATTGPLREMLLHEAMHVLLHVPHQLRVDVLEILWPAVSNSSLSTRCLGLRLPLGRVQHNRGITGAAPSARTTRPASGMAVCAW